MSNSISVRCWEPFPYEVISSVFLYNSETGVVKWRETGMGRHSKKNGVVGFKKGGSEYLAVKYLGKRLMLHRLAWCLHYGSWPTDLIDHINGDPGDNRISNLRQADKKLNTENQRRARSDNGLGVLGVKPHGRKFRAQVRSGGTTHYLGLFDTAELAHDAYVIKKREIHKGCSI